VNDIIQEFVYQLQGFCQYRCQVASRTAEEKQVLQANRSVWTFPAVSRTLSNLVRAGKAAGASELRRQFGSFAAVELARLECLIGDYSASLKALTTLNLNDRSEIFMQVPTCHVNVFYHAGLSYLMIRRYADAIDTFSDIALHVSRTLKPGAANLPKQIQSQLQKMLDKILSLTAIAVALCPGYKVDDQVRELVESKLGERFRKMVAGEVQVFVDIFEHTCPKFISPVVPDYSVAVNIGQEAFSNQVSVFIAEVMQQVSVLKIRSYMRMYTSIDLSTLAKFNEVSEPAFISQLISFRHKSMEVQNAPAGEEEKGVARVGTSDVQYYIQDQALVIDTTTAKSDKSRAIERFFTAGARKHVEIARDLNRAFTRIGI
jgi:translation initiation factor 3 subunit L